MKTEFKVEVRRDREIKYSSALKLELINQDFLMNLLIFFF